MQSVSVRQRALCVAFVILVSVPALFASEPTQVHRSLRPGAVRRFVIWISDILSVPPGR